MVRDKATGGCYVTFAAVHHGVEIDGAAKVGDGSEEFLDAGGCVSEGWMEGGMERGRGRNEDAGLETGTYEQIHVLFLAFST